MDPRPAGECAASATAIYLDKLFAKQWIQPGPTLLVATPGPGAMSIAYTCLSGHAVETLATRTALPCLAVGLTGLGSAIRLDCPSLRTEQTRATVAVGCCSVVTLLRHSDGRVESALETEGRLVEMLRDWADLAACPSCEGQWAQPRLMRSSTSAPHQSE